MSKSFKDDHCEVCRTELCEHTEKKLQELEKAEAKVKDLEEQLESIYSVSKPHTCRGNDYDNVGYWRCILCGAKYELTKKEKDA